MARAVRSHLPRAVGAAAVVAATCMAVCVSVAMGKSAPPASQWYMSPRTEADVEALDAWLRNTDGLYLHPNVSFTTDWRGDVSVVATGPVSPDAVVLAVPDTYFLCTAAVDTGDVAAQFSAPPPEGALLVHLATVRLLIETARGADSPVFPYINALPARVPLPHLYNEAAKDILRGAFMARSVANNDRDTLTAMQRARADWEDQRPFGSRSTSWAYSAVVSRAFKVPGTRSVAATRPNLPGNVCLIPGVDSLNHDVGGDVAAMKWSQRGAPGSDPDGRLYMRVIAPVSGYSAGDAVTVSYGGLPNHDLVSRYGFALRHNPHAQLPMSFDMDKLVSASHPNRATLRELQDRMADEVGASRPAYVLSAADGVPVSLCNFMRVSVMDADTLQSMLDDAKEDSTPLLRPYTGDLDVSVGLERLAALRLFGVLANNLAQYNTTAEQDLLLLVVSGGEVRRRDYPQLSAAAVTALTARYSETALLQELLVRLGRWWRRHLQPGHRWDDVAPTLRGFCRQTDDSDDAAAPAVAVESVVVGLLPDGDVEPTEPPTFKVKTSDK